LRATATTAEPIRWPEFVVCVLTRHHPDTLTYARTGRYVCLDCRIEIVRARAWRWRLLEWSLVGTAITAIAAPLALSAWWLR
jgi:hypothetical protein